MNGTPQPKPDAPKNTLQAPTSRCLLVFAYHKGDNLIDPKPTKFTGEKLRPLAEDAIKTKRHVHIIHERMYLIPIDAEFIVNNFESMLATPKVVRSIKEDEREQRMLGKKLFAKADIGEENGEISEEHNHLDQVILEFNRLHPRTILNHLNRYSFEAIVESSRSNVHGKRAEKAVGRNDFKRMLEENIKAQEAMARGMVLRDRELARQAQELMRSNPGDAFFIPRGINHSPMAKFFAESGIPFEAETEPEVPGFDQELLRLLQTSKLPRAEIERLSLLATLFTSHLVPMGDVSDFGNRQKAREIALDWYEDIRKEIFGGK